jgi:hypothetical protein
MPIQLMATMPGLRVRCRNQRCRSKLPVPTDNEHKAFCTPYCYSQFYNRRCKVCEHPIQRGRRRRGTRSLPRSSVPQGLPALFRSVPLPH